MRSRSTGTLDDLHRHAANFEARFGFTFIVLDPVTDDVIGCVDLYPSESPDADATYQRGCLPATRVDVLLADAVADPLSDLSCR